MYNFEDRYLRLGQDLGQSIDGVMPRYCDYETRATYTVCTDIFKCEKNVDIKRGNGTQKAKGLNEWRIFVFQLQFSDFLFSGEGVKPTV